MTAYKKLNIIQSFEYTTPTVQHMENHVMDCMAEEVLLLRWIGKLKITSKGVMTYYPINVKSIK